MLSRRSVLKHTALGVTGAGALLAGVPARAQASLAKDIAGYQESPKGPQRCELCKKFQPPSACNLVTGAVSPTGWCHFFSVTG
jgi:hypothetical protein